MKNTKVSVVIAGAAVALVAGLFMPASAYLGLIALLVLAAVGSAALIVQFERPFLGIALLVGMGVALPMEFRGPSAGMVSLPFPIAAFICGAWILHLVLVRDLRGVDASRVVYAAFGLMGIVLVAFATGQLPWFRVTGAPFPVQVVELGLFLLSPLLFLAVGHLISLNQLKWLTCLLVGAGLITCVLQMLPSLGFIARYTTRPGSVGSLFWTWLVAVTMAQALFNRKLSLPVRLGLAGVTALVMFHGLVQVRSWASGWLPAMAALGVIFLFRLPRLTIGAGLLSVPTVLLLQSFLSSELMGDEQYSLMTRQEAWRVLWQLVERSPLIGTGPVNYYFYTSDYAILGWHVKFFSHNNYQDLVLQTGILGLLVFGWFAFEVGSLTVRLYSQVQDGFAKAYVVGALGGLAGSLVAGMLGDWIIPFYYNGGIVGFRSSLLFWVFLGGLLVIKRQVAAGAAEMNVRARADYLQTQPYRLAVEAR